MAIGLQIMKSCRFFSLLHSCRRSACLPIGRESRDLTIWSFAVILQGIPDQARDEVLILSKVLFFGYYSEFPQEELCF
jgi:hypothetical protein